MPNIEPAAEREGAEGETAETRDKQPGA
jgi:hypothetical protein